MNRLVRCAFFATAFLMGSQLAVAQDILLQTRPGETLIGPEIFSQTVRGIDIPLRASAFLVTRPIEERLLIHARVVADFSSLQEKIGQIVDTIPLPRDNCARFKADNIVARIWGKWLSIDGQIATLKLSGDAENWACVKIFGSVAKTRLLEQSFDVYLPVELVKVDSQRIALKPGEPRVVLGGPFGDLADDLFRIIGVDFNREAKKALERALDANLLKFSLPDDLLWLKPEIAQVGLFSNNGSLAASAEMNAEVDANSFVDLLLMLLTRSHT